jgi:hypothetical protein
MLTVTDVEATSSWLQTIFALTSVHGGPEFDMLADGEGQVVMWLHRHDADHDHAQTSGLDMSRVGSGIVFYLQTGDIEATNARASALGATFVEELHHNPLAHHREFTIKSADGYLFAAHTALQSEPSS